MFAIESINPCVSCLVNPSVISLAAESTPDLKSENISSASGSPFMIKSLTVSNPFPTA